MLFVTLEKASDLFGYQFSHRQTCLDYIHAFQMCSEEGLQDLPWRWGACGETPSFAHGGPFFALFV